MLNKGRLNISSLKETPLKKEEHIVFRLRLGLMNKCLGQIPQI